MIPPRSSATARAARKTLSPIGTLVLNTERECDIRSHRDGKAPHHGCVVRTEKPEDEHRHQHTPACSYYRKKSFLTGGKFSDSDLAFDLKSDRQEEYGHQEVVYDLAYVHRMSVMTEEIEVTQ